MVSNEGSNSQARHHVLLSEKISADRPATAGVGGVEGGARGGWTKLLVCKDVQPVVVQTSDPMHFGVTD